MRISTDKTDAGFMPSEETIHWHVSLDGVDLTTEGRGPPYVETADEEQGYVMVFREPYDGTSERLDGVVKCWRDPE